MRVSLVLILTMLAGMVSAQSLVVRDNFEGETRGTPREVSFVPGKDGQAVLLSRPGSTIEFPAEHFGKESGRIELDVKLTQPLTEDHPFWCLFSDIGAAASHPGAINVHWRDKSSVLEYAIFDGSAHHWCYAKDIDWTDWRKVTLIYGHTGMVLEIDGKVVDTNPYAGGLANTPKRLGFHDAYVSAPPTMVDNFRTYRVNTDLLKATPVAFTPNDDGIDDTCTITYGLQWDSVVMLDVLDESGKMVSRLSHEHKVAGEYEIVWDGEGTRDGGHTLRLTARSEQGDRVLTEEMQIERRWKWRKPEYDFSSFPIGTWYFWEDDATYIGRIVEDDVRAKDYYSRTMKDLGDHGFNLIVPVWTPKHRRALMLDEAHKNGIRALVHIDEINHLINMGDASDRENVYRIMEDAVKDTKDHPAVAGYYLIDEPTNRPDVAARIARSMRALEMVSPRHPGFSCLLGGYEQLLETVNYPVLLIDIYPIGPNWNGSFAGYIGELERGQRNAGGRPMWVILQAFGKPNAWKIPTSEEISAQVWLALAHGAKGIVYFIYQSTTGYQGEWLQGMVDMDLKPMDDRLEGVGKINETLRKLGPVILTLEPADFEIPVRAEGLVVKGFADPSGVMYVVLANPDTTKTVLARWEGPQPTDVLTRAKTRSLIVLRPGDGRLLKISN